jgi:hypothetical protein
MACSISNATAPPPAAPPAGTSTQKSTPTAPAPGTNADSVQLSEAAQSALAAPNAG